MVVHKQGTVESDVQPHLFCYQIYSHTLHDLLLTPVPKYALGWGSTLIMLAEKW